MGRRASYDDDSVHGHHRESIPDSPYFEFVCPKCGVISQEDVVFLCNVCNSAELVYHGGIYMCPSCLSKGENFECMKCHSKEVVMKEKEGVEIKEEEKKEEDGDW